MTFDNAGRSIEVRLIGDENCHFYVTTDGYMLLRGADGVFHYAIPDGQRLRESSFPAENPRERRTIRHPPNLRKCPAARNPTYSTHQSIFNRQKPRGGRI